MRILALERKGLRINISKKGHTEYDEREQVNKTRSVITISGDEVREAESFKYLGSLYKKMGILTRI